MLCYFVQLRMVISYWLKAYVHKKGGFRTEKLHNVAWYWAPAEGRGWPREGTREENPARGRQVRKQAGLLDEAYREIQRTAAHGASSERAFLLDSYELIGRQRYGDGRPDAVRGEIPVRHAEQSGGRGAHRDRILCARRQPLCSRTRQEYAFYHFHRKHFSFFHIQWSH